MKTSKSMQSGICVAQLKQRLFIFQVVFIYVSVLFGTSANAQNNIAIDEITPRNVCIGETVTITGRNLDKVNRIRFNDVLLELSAGAFVIVDKKTITFPAPSGAVTNGVESVTTMIYAISSGILPADVYNQNMSINPLPSPPSNPSGSSYCESGKVSSVSVNDPGAGFRIDWYDKATGGTLLGSGSTHTPSGPGTFYAERVNTGTGCSSSSRVSATITVLPSPPPPSGASGSEFCQGDPVSSISVNNPGGGFRIDWFDASSGGNFLGSGTTFTPSAPGTYYAETYNTSTTCRSTSRTSVTVTRNAAPPAPSGAKNSSFCSGDPVSSVSVNDPGSGFRIDWYNAAQGGSLLGSGATYTPSDPGTFYAETINTSTSCRSSSRTSATVTRTAPPSPPTGAKSSSYCNGDPVSAVSVNNPGSGFRIDWYDAATGGNLLGSGANFKPGGPGKYFAETVNTSSSCSSESRVAASVTENPAPPAPGGAKGSSNCPGEKVNPISVNNPGSGFRIEWYGNPTGGNLLATGISYSPNGAGTYYAQTVNENTSCRSLTRTAVRVTQYPSPPAATGPVNAAFCPVEDVPPIRVDDPGAGFTIVWYKNPTGTTRAEGNTSGNNGEVFTPSSKSSSKYYAEVRNDESGCVSEKRTEVSVEVDQENCSRTDFLAFSFDEETRAAEINDSNHTIDAEVVFGTSLTDLVAEFNLPAGAVARVNGKVQESGVTVNNFSDPVIYTVTAADGETTQDWEVTVNVAPDTGTDFFSFNFLEQSKPTDINRTNNTVNIEVPLGTDLTNLVANFSLPDGAVATVNGVEQVSGETPNNFTSTVTYVVTAQDGVTKEEWKVNVEEQELIDNENPVISSISLPDEYPVDSDSILASIAVNDDVKVKRVVFRYKKYQDTQWTEVEVPENNSVFSHPISRADVGSHGMFYYFKAYDLVNKTDSGMMVNMILRFNDENSPAIPDLKFGSTIEDYQIISIPLNLANATVENIFNELMPYDKKNWRLFHYSDTVNQEYGDGFTAIEPGKSYWLIIRNQTEIKTGAGTTPRMEQPNGLTVTLAPGWNQVGNPYNFDISWDQVIALNADRAINSIKLYDNGALIESDTIPSFGGGFVFSAWDQPLIVSIPPNPVIRNGRVAGGGETDNQQSMDSREWFIPITAISGKFRNSLQGFGMHPDSHAGFDPHDEPVLPVPREISGFEMYFLHPGEKYEKLSRDVVASKDFHIWEFEIQKFNNPGNIKLQWEEVSFNDSRYGLILTDLSGKKIIDMTESDSYTFHASNLHKFRIFYGNRERLEQDVLPLEIAVGEIYPNPFDKEFFIPISLPDGFVNYQVTVSLSDLQGRTVQQLPLIELGAGNHEISCDLHQSMINSRSFYLLRVYINAGNFNRTIYRKILKR
jgi:hypothetical protein